MRALIAIGALGLCLIAIAVVTKTEVKMCHNPSSHAQVSEANQKTEEQRQKKTPDSLERDSGENEADDAR